MFRLRNGSHLRQAYGGQDGDGVASGTLLLTANCRLLFRVILVGLPLQPLR
jgi:hypothetical protein